MNTITIGRIIGTHGLKGTLKIKSFTDFIEERYQKGAKLFIAFKDELIPVTVTSFRSHKGVELVDVKEYKHINEVEKFKGAYVVIDEEAREDLEEDAYYYNELIGLEVYAEGLLGVVSDIRELPQGELLEVKTKEKTVLIPFRKEFVVKVDMEGKRIDVDLVDGFL
jgi:16S rRNA processing protein RimM